MDDVLDDIIDGGFNSPSLLSKVGKILHSFRHGSSTARANFWQSSVGTVAAGMVSGGRHPSTTVATEEFTSGDITSTLGSE